MANSIGKQGEDAAVGYLKSKGLNVIECNFYCKFGEIDIIAEIKEFIVFIEVKTRKKRENMINPLLSINKRKCNKVRMLATLYLVKNKIYDKQPRFDVIGVVLDNYNNVSIEHIENAF